MLGREKLKNILKASGIFPIAREVYRRINPAMSRQLAHEAEFYKTVLIPDSMVFDVGANLGGKTNVMLSAGAKFVVTIEPNPKCYENLNFYFKRHPRVALVQSAVGPEDGSITLYANGSSAAGSVLPDWNKTIFGNDYVTSEIIVPMTTLDRLIEKFGTPDYLKIDIEGFEEEALRGLSTKIPLVSFEFFHNDLDLIRNCLSLLGRFGKLTVRCSDMDCGWISDATDDLSSIVREIETRRLCGDLFVWTA